MEDAASRELLRSEFYRTSLILITTLVLMLVVLTLFAVGSDNSPHLQSRMMRGLVVLAALAVYESIVLVLLNRWRRQRRPSPWDFRYFNTFVEVTVPVLILALLGAQIGIAQTLLGAAPFFLFILIVLSALYLDFGLCTFAGLIGNVVNLASRIEQATKQFNAQLLVSEAVQQQLDAARYPAEDLGEVELKGQAKPTRLFRLA